MENCGIRRRLQGSLQWPFSRSSTASCVRHNQIRTLLLNQGLHRRRGVHHQERQHRHRLGGRLGLHRQPDGRFESAAAKSIGSRRITT